MHLILDFNTARDLAGEWMLGKDSVFCVQTSYSKLSCNRNVIRAFENSTVVRINKKRNDVKDTGIISQRGKQITWGKDEHWRKIGRYIISN